MASKRLFVGIDLGGTKISTALVDESGEIAAHDYRETRAGQGPEAVIGRMLDAARGVIASAGFSLISECLYLKKRMLVLPVAGQYEQVINAHYVQKLGLGVWAKELSEGAIGEFLEQVDDPMPEDERILWPDNERFFAILQQELNKLNAPVSIGPAG